MFTQEVTYADLGIQQKDIYEQMGYGESTPDADVLRELSDIEARISSFLRPQFCFFLAKGTLDEQQHTLTVGGKTFQIGRIISRQLRGSQAFAFFVATGGMAFEAFQQQLKAEGDMVKAYLADSVGSVLAERTADLMETSLQATLQTHGWHHTNRFSPGYCGWHVSKQQQLFSLFPTPEPCGVRLTPSSLMVPIKSVSGVIGVGESVKKLDYTCGLCDFALCYKRRKKPQKHTDSHEIA